MAMTVLVATDLCEGGDAAVDRVEDLLATHRGWRVVLVHVIDQRMLDGIASTGISGTQGIAEVAHSAADTALQHIAERLHKAGAAEVIPRLRCGRPASDLLQEISAQSPELVIAGVGNQMWRQVLLGSTVRRLIRDIAVPLWLVRARHGAPVSKALLASDFQPSSDAALRLLGTLLPKAHIEAVHVCAAADALPVGVSETPELRAARVQQEAALLERLRAQVAAVLPHRKVHCDVLAGHPVGRLLERAGQLSVQLLVVGRHGRAGMERQVLGSVAEALADTAPCDVLLAPP